MPSSDYGFSGNEIVSFVTSWIGNSSTEFQTFVENLIPICEMRFCKLADWPFLQKQNLSLTVSSGTQEYTLNSAGIGYYMQAEDVKTVYSEATNRVLVKVDLDRIRRLDADNNDGSATAELQLWAPSGDNKIVVWPKTFSDTALKIDGKITPSALLTLSNYPTIPFRYQEAFIEFVLAKALERENDTRAAEHMKMAFQLANLDQQDAKAALGDTEFPRIKHWAEVQQDNVSVNDIDALNMRD